MNSYKWQRKEKHFSFFLNGQCSSMLRCGHLNTNNDKVAYLYIVLISGLRTADALSTVILKFIIFKI